MDPYGIIRKYEAGDTPISHRPCGLQQKNRSGRSRLSGQDIRVVFLSVVSGCSSKHSRQNKTERMNKPGTILAKPEGDLRQNALTSAVVSLQFAPSSHGTRPTIIGRNKRLIRVANFSEPASRIPTVPPQSNVLMGHSTPQINDRPFAPRPSYGRWMRGSETVAVGPTRVA